MKDTAPQGTRAASEANGRNGAHVQLPDDTWVHNANDKHRQQLAVQAAVEDRKNRWKPRWFAVASLAGIPHEWARNLAWKYESKNAFRDPITDLPTLMFCGVEAVEAGASDEQLAAIPRLQPADVAMLKLRAAAIRQDCRKQVDSLARTFAVDRDCAVAPPEPMGLDALLEQPDEDAAYRIGDLWPTGGRVLLAAQYKSGKSTLVGNVLRALVDGGQFLGRFDVIPASKVALIDTELDTRTLRRWLRDQGIANTEAVSVLSLRGAVSTLDILDPATRAEWARRLHGADVVILDCLRPVLDALGLSEDKDAGRVLVAFDALLAEVGATEGMVVTHMGHQAERARGDSRLLDWPDALWKIVRGGDDENDDTESPRYLSAIGRDVAVTEGQLTYDTATRHLTYAGGNRRDSAATAALPQLHAMVRAEPGMLSKRAVEARLCAEHGLPRRTVRSAVEKAIREGSLIVTSGERGAHKLSPGPDPFTLPDRARTP
ncbi:AAA family ATPase [Mycobacterium paraffinicum]|uniref:AAA+ ATPase domain-containing protein n=1 Tax=Mycobacterium paraffinicum TaxID=53378 RepID=A0ABP8EZT3_9MYCO|nr:AAA family ATPase [Mycobacterium paraffinicum]MCV7311786.1 AAA family ATPase [Mycobacterium paraffinicum]